MGDTELIDPTDEQYYASRQVPCTVPWCRSKKRRRVGKTKNSAGSLEYPICGDRSGDYAGLLHKARIDAIEAAKTKVGTE